MASYNKVILMGNLTEDPTLRYSGGGMAICNFNIAVNSVFGSGDKKKEEVLFIKISTFSKQAENCGQYLKKGNPVHIDGRLKISSYEDKDGNKRYSTEVVADSVKFLSKPNGENQKPKSGKVDINSIEDIPDSDVPF